jgi:hypothetical protein
MLWLPIMDPIRELKSADISYRRVSCPCTRQPARPGAGRLVVETVQVTDNVEITI